VTLTEAWVKVLGILRTSPFGIHLCHSKSGPALWIPLVAENITTLASTFTQVAITMFILHI
jgi:hypothetical protein